MPLDSPISTTLDDGALLDAYSRAVTSVVDRVGPAVVRVERIADGQNSPGGVGSGVVIAGDGLVLTNSHVVGGASRVRLSFADGSAREARVLGDDPDTDLALLRCDLLPARRRHASQHRQPVNSQLSLSRPLDNPLGKDSELPAHVFAYKSHQRQRRPAAQIASRLHLGANLAEPPQHFAARIFAGEGRPGPQIDQSQLEPATAGMA